MINVDEELDAINRGLEFCRQLDALEDEYIEKMDNKELWDELKSKVDNMNKGEI